MTATLRSSSPRPTILLRVALAFLLAACGADRATAPVAAGAAPARDVAAGGIWSQQVTGETGPGSTYAMMVPNGWTGDAVFYAHGFRDVDSPVALRDDQDGWGAMRDSLGARGIAVAYSSADENGYALQDGVQRTHQLRGLFASRFGQPTRAFLVGHSLGALVAVNLAETHPDQYAGALPICGVLGGTRRELEYVGNVRALFDVFYPHVLPGSVGEIPEGLDLNAQVIGPALAAVQANPMPVFLIASTAQTPLPYPPNAPQAAVQSLLTAIGFHARGLADLTGRTHGHLPFTNEGIDYTSPLFTAPVHDFVNGTVARVSTTPDAERWLDKWYEPTGDLRIPVLSLHTLWDPTVPYFHETDYAARVAGAGRSALLVQRGIPAYGHCTIDINQTLAGFDTLRGWVTTGVRPSA